ncbi:amidohydrolase [Tessaracoccus sp. MC1865]|uniref:M20 metallopeptidase family protein n=1 Tax=Tessaracoccus sp. MC1865 TaxID=2760310 RepID=UPI001602A6D5|nr:M20 family metallopeptidase [Tessaracoccus sp. MC1865]MBB1483799.1 amidohydrolase [Tessaracoccus sp. MC1865]QTO36861.1 amidohydrolase [Tessaracoccus sp. MC1865]
MSLLEELTAAVDGILPDAAALRRAIHAEPYVSGEEGPTRDRLVRAMGWLDWTPVAGTGAWARLGPAGPAVGLRAELDALPVMEATGVEWESRRPGVAHACGHDVHMAALWAVTTAARSLDLPVGLVPVLQPREEVTPPGAGDVVRSGLLDEQEIEAMIGVHLQPQVDRGVVSTGAGAVNAAYDSFEIVVRGRPGHGAYPHVAVDPISALATIIGELQSLPGRIINPTHPTVISVGQIAGGTAHNVIADQASCQGSIRTYSEADRALLHEAVARLASAIAESRGGQATTRFVRGGPALLNDPGLVKRIDPLLRGLGLTVAETPFRSCGSDDFAEYGREAASVMCFIGTGHVDGVGLHHGAFLPGREALQLAAHAFAAGYVAAAALIAA